MSNEEKNNDQKYTIVAIIEKIKYNDGKVQLKLRGCDKHIYGTENPYFNILVNSKGKPEILDENSTIHIQFIGNDIPYTISHAFLEKKKLTFELKKEIDGYHIVGLSHAT